MLTMNYLLLTLVLSSSILLSARQPCYHRWYGKGGNLSPVCVCNQTHCDDLDPIRKTDKGVVTVFETNIEGDRFKEVALKLGPKRDDSLTNQTITIDKTRKAQTIVGFGASFTDATGYMISLLAKPLQQHIIRDFYSDHGLEYNLNRIPIGGADFSLRGYTYDDNHPDDFNLDHFNLTMEDFNYKFPYMTMAKSVSPHPQKYFGSTWSCPAWMKKNNILNNYGAIKGAIGGPYYKAFAKYIIKFLDAYKKEGFPQWGITIANEPGGTENRTHSINGIYFPPDIERDFIKTDLGPALASAGYGKDKLQLMTRDNQINGLITDNKVILGDKEADQYVTGLAYHWYGNNAKNFGNLNQTHDLWPDKFILNTEASNAQNPDPMLGTWHNLEHVCSDIITVLNNHIVGYVHWNMVLNLEGGPNWVNLTADAPIISNPDQQEYYKQPEYYGYGHIMKFISPGSQRLVHQQSPGSDKLLSTVFQRPDGGVVVVVLNTDDKEGFEYTIRVMDTDVKHSIPRKAMQTLIFWD